MPASELAFLIVDDEEESRGKIEERLRHLASASLFTRVHCSSYDEAQQQLQKKGRHFAAAIIDNYFFENNAEVPRATQLIALTRQQAPEALIIVVSNTKMQFVSAEEDVGPNATLAEPGIRYLSKKSLAESADSLATALQDAAEERDDIKYEAEWLFQKQPPLSPTFVLEGFLKRIEDDWAETVISKGLDDEEAKIVYMPANYFRAIGLTGRNSRFRFVAEWHVGEYRARVESLASSEELRKPVQDTLNKILEFKWDDNTQ